MVGVDIVHPKWFNVHMGLIPNPHDSIIEAHTQEDAYCPVCDLAFVGLDTLWFTDHAWGEAECPECGGSIDVRRGEEDW